MIMPRESPSDKLISSTKSSSSKTPLRHAYNRRAVKKNATAFFRIIEKTARDDISFRSKVCTCFADACIWKCVRPLAAGVQLESVKKIANAIFSLSNFLRCELIVPSRRSATARWLQIYNFWKSAKRLSQGFKRSVPWPAVFSKLRGERAAVKKV